MSSFFVSMSRLLVVMGVAMICLGGGRTVKLWIGRFKYLGGGNGVLNS